MALLSTISPVRKGGHVCQKPKEELLLKFLRTSETAELPPESHPSHGRTKIQLEDADMQRFLLSGMLVFTDKVITKEDSKQIKEWIMMTKVGQLFEEEKIQYGREIEKNVTKTNELKFSKILLHAGLSIEEISNAMTVLNFSECCPG